MNKHKATSILLLFFLLIGMFSDLPLGSTTAEAYTGDPNIISYRNINIPATTNSFTHPDTGTLSASINDQQLTNVQYNRTTKQLTFDISSSATNTVSANLVPSNSALDKRVAAASMCVAVIPEGQRLDDDPMVYRCPAEPGFEYVWHTKWTPLEIGWFHAPFDGNAFSTTFNLGTETPYKKVIGKNYWDELPAGIAVSYYYGAGQNNGLDANGFHPDDGFAGPAMFTWFTKVFPLIPNSPPTLSINSPNDQVLQNEPGRSSMNIEGYVHDPDNEDLIVSAEIPNVFYKKTVVTQTKGYKPFFIPIDVIDDSLPPGDYTIIVKVSDPSNMTDSKSMTVKVRNRLKRNAYVLVNSPIDNSGTTYADYESDPKFLERVKYQHDPNYFENSMGIISDSGLWRNTLYHSFPYTGQYVVTYQAKDIPKTESSFAEYQMWSRDAASTMSFLVHRKPIALFSAKLVGSSIVLADSSYDLDHISTADKGLMQWQWQYKKSYEDIWTDGQPTGAISAKDNYDIRLRVRDVDGNTGAGAWSDWCQRSVGTAAGNLPPVAMFTVNPSIVSYGKATTIIDKSFDPDNDPLDTYKWTVVKDGWNTVWSHYGAANTPPNIAAYGVGDYQITLQVRDNRGLWSNPYSQNVQVVNHPPVAAFNMPNEVYRDTLITLDNQTPDPDKDGDALTYTWNAKINNSAYYWSGNNRNQSLTIRDLIARNGISPKQAISDGWEMRLSASDGSFSSNATRSFAVRNHVPVAAINGATEAHQYDTLTYTSNDVDEDTSDQSSLAYYWKVTNSDGTIKSYRTPNVTLTFPETGVYTLEHWAIDQIGDKSNVAVLQVNVLKNFPPSMVLTLPAGTHSNPTIIDAALQGDPLIKWTYSDPENDAQEKYHLDFFSKDDDLLVYSVENSDSTGLLRQYQVPNKTFERFKYFYLNGSVYSKYSWSDVSNEKAFIIDNPPQPGFTLMTDTGRNAAQVPIYRTDILQVYSTATDLDIPNGDSIGYQYFLKPAGGTEGLASAQGSYDKQFSSNGTFTLRQIVKDSLGLYRELTQSITVENRLPTANITYPTSSNQTSPTIVSTLSPVIRWNYQDEDRDIQQRYRVRIINLDNGALQIQSGEQTSSSQQWQVPAGALIENERYAVEVEVFDGFDWSRVLPRKYFMVNLLNVKGAVQHTVEWDNNRQGYNLKKSGNAESPRGYSVFWAGERFILRAEATGLPDTIEVTMAGGYTTLLRPTDNHKTLWTGELYDPAFEKLPNGPVLFTFTARNAYNTKTDSVTVTIDGDWTTYFQSHRVK